MIVTATRTFHEDGRDYAPGALLRVAPSRGWRLEELGLVKAPAPWEYEWDDEWEAIRQAIGAGPSNPVWPTRRHSIKELRAGESLLLIRKLGGLGDILVQSMLFPDINDQYPESPVSYAIPQYYHPLFQGATGVTVEEHAVAYSSLGLNYAENTAFTWGDMRPDLLARFHYIDDISRCCLDYENLTLAYRVPSGAWGLRWRDRLDIWSRYIGLTIKNARTCIRLLPAEIAEARARFRANGKPVLVWAPMSGSDQRSYPWYADVTKHLTKRWQVYYLHDQPLPDQSVPTLTGLSLRQMGATVAAADAVLAVDSSVFHWGGILQKPTVGLFNFLTAEARAKYYPTARVLQACATPCLGAKYASPPCELHTQTPRYPQGPGGRGFSRCYHPEDIAQIITAVEALR